MDGIVFFIICLDNFFDTFNILTDLLEHYAVGSASVSEGSSGEGSETEVSQKKTD